MRGACVIYIGNSELLVCVGVETWFAFAAKVGTKSCATTPASAIPVLRDEMLDSLTEIVDANYKTHSL